MEGGEDKYEFRGWKISILQMLQGRSVYESEDAEPCPVEGIKERYCWMDHYDERLVQDALDSLHNDPSSPLNYCTDEETHVLLSNPQVTKTFKNALKEKQDTR